VVFEWFFAFHARSADKGILAIGLFRNPWLIRSMLTGLALQMAVVYLPAANRIFHTRPLTGVELLWTLLPAVTVVVLESLRKRVVPQLFSSGQWKVLGRLSDGRT